MPDLDPRNMSPEQRTAFLEGWSKQRLGYPDKPSVGRLQEYFDEGGLAAERLQSASSNG